MSKKHRPKIKLFSVNQEDVKPSEHLLSRKALKI